LTVNARIFPDVRARAASRAAREAAGSLVPMTI
jgi:hypothetical protein